MGVRNFLSWLIILSGSIRIRASLAADFSSAGKTIQAEQEDGDNDGYSGRNSPSEQTKLLRRRLIFHSPDQRIFRRSILSFSVTHNECQQSSGLTFWKRLGA